MKNTLDNATVQPKKIKQFSAMKVIYDFTNTTSIHGIKYLVYDPLESGIIGRILWICVLILSFVGSGLMTKLFWNRYQAHPTVSAVESFYTPLFLTSFPALTVCPIIGPDSEIRSKFLQGLRLPDDISRERASILLKHAFELAHPRSEMYEDRNQLNEILKLNDFHLTDLLIGLRIPCDEIVESCWWELEKISCKRNFRQSYTFGGLCCSFNYLLENHVNSIRNYTKVKPLTPLRAVNFGINSGLTLVFKGEPFILNDSNGTIERLNSNTIGHLLFIHHSMVYPDSSSLIMQSEREMQLRISATANTKIRGLGGEDEQPCFSEDVEIKYFAEYWKENCYNSCRIRASLALCHCVPWLFASFVNKSAICGFSQMKCLKVYYKEIWSVMYVENPSIECICPTRCEIRSFQVTHSQIPIAANIFALSPIYQNLSTEKAVLKMYMGEQVYDKAINLKVADEVYLLSSIGGIFSLFLGCSIISLCEIIYFILIFIESKN